MLYKIFFETINMNVLFRVAFVDHLLVMFSSVKIYSFTKLPSLYVMQLYCLFEKQVRHMVICYLSVLYLFDEGKTKTNLRRLIFWNSIGLKSLKIWSTLFFDYTKSFYSLPKVVPMAVLNVVVKFLLVYQVSIRVVKK